MGLRSRGGKLHWRYMLDGKEYSGTTDLDATGPARTVKRNRDAAMAEMVAHRQAIREGRKPGRKLEARRFSDAADEFLRWCEVEHRDHPATALRVRTSFTSLRAELGGLMVGQITPARIEQYKLLRAGEHAVADVTLRHDLHALSKFFRWAERMGYAAENPVASVRIPSDKDAVRMHVLSAGEERAYFAAAAKDQALYDIGRLLLNQGMRPDELLRLDTVDVDLERGTAKIRHGKTKAARRTLNLTAESRSILARRVTSATAAKRKFLFAGRPSRKRTMPRLTASGVAKKHARALGVPPKGSPSDTPKVGFDFVPYDLRHTFATRMAQAGCDLATLAAILGHSSLRLLDRYIHPTAAHQARAMRLYETAQLGSGEAVQ